MKDLLNKLPDIFLTRRLLGTLLALVVIFVLGFPYPILFSLGKVLFLVLLAMIGADLLFLYGNKAPITGKRVCEDKFSNGDPNPVQIVIQNHTKTNFDVEILDEFPDQFQVRNFVFNLKLNAKAFNDVQFELRPTERGVYKFHNINVFLMSILGLVKRRVIIQAEREVAVYPSFIQLKKYAFYALNDRLTELGVKKIRRLGLNNEFEQIREYVRGDDIRVVNWKATARRNQLMVNQFQEERSQQVYCLIDKGRLMHMPFDGLTLIDYAINASLVMSNIAIAKDDKAGLITFSNKIGSLLKASKKTGQMNVILESLYKQKVRLQESDFGRLYRNIKHTVKQRSLMLLFTNFESVVSLNRHIEYIRAIARDHLVVVVIFQNSELEKEPENKGTLSTEDIYVETIKQKFMYEKKLIIKEFQKYGIQAILTKPENLTINAINKYIELKARGAI